MHSQKSVRFTLWCNRILIAVMIILCFTLYDLLVWYMGLRNLNWQVGMAILIGFYCCVPGILYALWCIDQLLRNIVGDQVFISANVRFIRHISWCCSAVSVICLAAGILYPPLLFLAVIMVFLALVVSVVKNVISAAVAIREENDLTV